MNSKTSIQVDFQERELCAVERSDFHWGDEQVACSVLFDLDDGEEVIRVELSQNTNDTTYLCHLVMINKNFDIRVAANGRGVVKDHAVATTFERAKITFAPTLAELNNPHPHASAYRINVIMKEIAQRLGVKRYKIFSAGSDPFK